MNKFKLKIVLFSILYLILGVSASLLFFWILDGESTKNIFIFLVPAALTALAGARSVKIPKELIQDGSVKRLVNKIGNLIGLAYITVVILITVLI